MGFTEDMKALLKQVCTELKNNNLHFCLDRGWAGIKEVKSFRPPHPIFIFLLFRTIDASETARPRTFLKKGSPVWTSKNFCLVQDDTNEITRCYSAIRLTLYSAIAH